MAQVNSGHRVCVVMPTYNERDNLEPTLTDLFLRNAGVDVLIVDDNSPDGTGTLADVISRVTRLPQDLNVEHNENDVLRDVSFADEDSDSSLYSDTQVSTQDLKIADRLASCTMDSRVFVLHRPGKQGLGTAYIQGFEWALGHRYDIVCEMDMDGSHRPQDLRAIIDVLERHPQVDLVLGSRRVPGGSTQDWPWYRDVISRAGSQYARVMLGLKVRDMTSGFRAYRSRILRHIDLVGIDANGYVFQIDMTRRVIAAGGHVVEVPIVFPDRTKGDSKLDGSIVREAMRKVTQWGFTRMQQTILHNNERMERQVEDDLELPGQLMREDAGLAQDDPEQSEEYMERE